MKHKYVCSILLVLVLLCTCLTGAVAEEEREIFTSGDYEYALLDDATVEITGYTGRATELSIPDMLDGKMVTSIDDMAFFKHATFTSISILDSIVHIGVNPFASCTALKSISLSPDNPALTVIDDVLFRKTDKSLISFPPAKEITTYSIPQGITSIGDWAFCRCASLVPVSIPDSVTSIGDTAFAACASLVSVSIPSSVTFIGSHAFSSCKSLFSVSIPNSVSLLGDSTFYRCSSLTSVSIPDSVSFIDDNAFFACKSLTSISIPNSVTSIGASAFTLCESLTSIFIPNSVTFIDKSAFTGCQSLTSVSIPDSVTSIGEGAFSNCPNLTLTVPRNSYAAEYAKANSIPYTYPNANDWLNN